MTPHDIATEADGEPPTQLLADKLLLAEEIATISKRGAVTGRVRVSTRVDTVEQLVMAQLHSDAVEVTRVPVNRPVEGAPPVRVEGEVTIVPVLEEVLVV